MKGFMKNVVTVGAFIGVWKIVDYYTPKSTNPIVSASLALVKAATSLVAANAISESAEKYIPEKKRSIDEYVKETNKKYEKTIGEEISEKVKEKMRDKANTIIDRIFGKSETEEVSMCEEHCIFSKEYKNGGDAFEALCEIENQISEKGKCTVAAAMDITKELFSSLLPMKTFYYGWYSIQDFNIKKTENGYTLFIPPYTKL